MVLGCWGEEGAVVGFAGIGTFPVMVGVFVGRSTVPGPVEEGEVG